MKQKKYNFIPEHQLNGDSSIESEFTISITKAGFIYIDSFVTKMYDLVGKVVRIYVDEENKTISWKEVKEGNLEELKHVRFFRAVSKTNKAVTFSIQKIMKRLGFGREQLPIKNVPVTDYKDYLLGDFKVIDLKKYVKKQEEREQ